MSRRAKKNAARAVLGAVLLAMALFALLPFVYMGLVSLTQKTVLDLRFDPAEFSFKNYARVFSNFNIGRNLLNSVIVTGGSVRAQLHRVRHGRLRLCKKAFSGARPAVHGLSCHIDDTRAGDAHPGVHHHQKPGADEHPHRADAAHPERVRCVSGAAVHVNVPDELIEAARIDGCGENRLFLSVVVPLVKPVLVSLTIFTFITCWNDFLWPLVTVTDERMQTLTLAIAALKGNYSTNYGLVMAGSTLAFLPPFLLYVALQKEFVEGIALSGIKG